MVCDYIIKFLEDKGVKDIFLLTGGGAMYLNDALTKTKMNIICMQHETTMAMAVKSYAMACGFGVGIFTSGPGSTNAVTGVAEAWLDSVPCMFLSGQANNWVTESRQIGIQAIDMSPIIKSITKYAGTLVDSSNLKEDLENLYQETKKGRPGPIWLQIPLDVQQTNYSG